MSDMLQNNPDHIHKRLLILLKKFHRICVENNIQYSLDSGTLLGSIREKGFIPWDDDADVSMMRSEYIRLAKILNDVGEKFGIVFDNISHYVPKVIMYDHSDNPVWIDIFIYDYISERKIFQKMKLAILTFLIMFSKSREMMKIVKAAGRCTGWKYWCYDIISRIGSIFPHAKRIKWLNNFCQHCFVGEKTMIHRGMDEYSLIGKIYPKNIMDQFCMTAFEDTQLMISAKYQDILVSIYGEDYMIPKRYHTNEEVHNVMRDISGKQ